MYTSFVGVIHIHLLGRLDLAHLLHIRVCQQSRFQGGRFTECTSSVMKYKKKHNKNTMYVLTANVISDV